MTSEPIQIEERDVRPCPSCNQPVDVTDWPSHEANSCEGCGAPLYINFDDTLVATTWDNVEF